MKIKKVVIGLCCFFFYSQSFGLMIAKEDSKPFQDITLVEHVFIGTYPTSEEMIEIARIKSDPTSFLVISLPHRFEDSGLTTVDTQNRGDIYCQPIQIIPVLAVAGKVDPRDAVDSKHWSEVIQQGVADHHSMAEFSYYIASNRQFVLRVQGTDEKLSDYKNVNLNVVFFQDWVPCQWGNGDTMVRNLARKFPLGALGIQRNIPVKGIWEEKFDVVIPDETRQMYGVVAFLQDMDSFGILASGTYRFTSAQTPARFSWKNWPKATYDLDSEELVEAHIQKTGLAEMRFQVQNAQDIRLLQIEMDYTPEEAKFYDVLAFELNSDLLATTTLMVDLVKKKINLYFQKPLNGDIELFSWIVHWKKQNLEQSSSFKVKLFSAYNSQNEMVCFDLQDIRQYYPNMLLIRENPLDFSKDTWIDEDDLFLFLPHFGAKIGDREYDEDFDIVKKTEQKIDFEDFCALLSAIKTQYMLWKKLPTV